MWMCEFNYISPAKKTTAKFEFFSKYILNVALTYNPIWKLSLVSLLMLQYWRKSTILRQGINWQDSNTILNSQNNPCWEHNLQGRSAKGHLFQNCIYLNWSFYSFMNSFITQVLSAHLLYAGHEVKRRQELIHTFESLPSFLAYPVAYYAVFLLIEIRTKKVQRRKKVASQTPC